MKVEKQEIMDREDFAKRLYSTVIPEGTVPEDIQTMTRPISEAIREIMPKKLFRYRAFNDRSFDAFLSRKYEMLYIEYN